jgi:hypothetical protein
MKEMKLFWMILVLGLGLSLSACGDDDDDGDGDETDTGTGTENKGDETTDTGSGTPDATDTGTGETEGKADGESCATEMGTCAASASECTAGSIEDLAASMSAMTEAMMDGMPDLGFDLTDMADQFPGMSDLGDLADVTGECAGVCCINDTACDGLKTQIDAQMVTLETMMAAMGGGADGGMAIDISIGCQAAACEGGEGLNPWGCPNSGYCCIDVDMSGLMDLLEGFLGGGDGGLFGGLDLSQFLGGK